MGWNSWQITFLLLFFLGVFPSLTLASCNSGVACDANFSGFCDLNTNINVINIGGPHFVKANICSSNITVDCQGETLQPINLFPAFVGGSVSNVTIRNCVFHGIGGPNDGAISIDGVNNFTSINNTFTDIPNVLSSTNSRGNFVFSNNTLSNTTAANSFFEIFPDANHSPLRVEFNSNNDLSTQSNNSQLIIQATLPSTFQSNQLNWALVSLDFNQSSVTGNTLPAASITVHGTNNAFSNNDSVFLDINGLNNLVSNNTLASISFTGSGSVLGNILDTGVLSSLYGGFYVTDANVTINQNIFRKGNSLQISHSSGVDVRDNTFESTAEGGIILTDVNNATITQNDFQSVQLGLSLNESNDNSITNNDFLYGLIDLFSSNGNLLSTNSLDSSSIAVSSSSNNIFSSNILLGSGMLFTGNTNGNEISFNTFNSSPGAAIQEGDGPFNFNSNDFHHNIINGGQTGLALNNSSSTYRYNTITTAQTGISNQNFFGSPIIEYNTIEANGLNVSSIGLPLLVENNYWGEANVAGNQDCQLIDDKISDQEEGGGMVDFNPILDAPYPTGVPEDKCTPILLVHGIYSSDAIWSEGLTDELDARGMRYRLLGPSIEQGHSGFYPNNGPIQGSAAQLLHAVNKVLSDTGEPSLDIVAHSMGGLVARYYSLSPAFIDGSVRHLVMLGTPNEGAPIANSSIGSLLGLGAGDSLFDTARYQMIPGSLFLEDPQSGLNTLPENPSIDYSAIAGNALPNSYWKRLLVCVSAPSYCGVFNPLLTDSIVPVSSVNHFGTGTCSEAPVTHASSLGTSYYNNPGVIQDTVNQLLGNPSQYPQCTQSIAPFEPTVSTQIDMINGAISGTTSQMVFSTNNTGANFSTSLNWKDGRMHLVLTNPSGQDINLDNYQSFPGVSFQTENVDQNTVESFVVSNPATGNWMVKVTSKNIPAPENFFVGVLRETPISLSTQTDNTIISPNAQVRFTAKLVDVNIPVLGSSVKVAIRQPSGVIVTRSLKDDGLNGDVNANDGVYSFPFVGTSQLGAYSYQIDANGTGSNGLFHLYNNSTFFVDSKPDVMFDNNSVTFLPATVQKNKRTIIQLAVQNIGPGPATDAIFEFFDEDPELGEIHVGDMNMTISPGQTVHLNMNWVPKTRGQHYITVRSSPFNPFYDVNNSNEGAVKSIFVCGSGPGFIC